MDTSILAVVYADQRNSLKPLAFVILCRPSEAYLKLLHIFQIPMKIVYYLSFVNFIHDLILVWAFGWFHDGFSTLGGFESFLGVAV